MTDRKRCDECEHYRHSDYGHPYWGRCVVMADEATLPTWLVRLKNHWSGGEVPTQGYDEGCPRWEAK
jgi:hypothetical protein